ncbi:MAG: hypothetical protein JWL61_2546 [Gemmatimonadetes bacterium]|nr:hypothetical protein [Gemmatimonadota bacterium]
MSAEAYNQVITAPRRDRRDLFLTAAQRLGTTVGNIEKDFWVCWTLNVLYHGLPPNSPRLLFKGGTSLSKAYDLIQRFSEDIDVTVFRDDLDQPASADELGALSGRQRRAKLDAIREACHAYVIGPLRAAVATRVTDATDGQGHVDIDPGDADGQTLLVSYPAVEDIGDAYVRPVVRIELGAKSALDPHRPASIRPYIAADSPGLDFNVADVMTIEPARTLWDKIVIAHGLRRWYEQRRALRQEGERISRHYYDLHCLLHSDMGGAALADRALGADCVRHARMFFFDRPDYDLASARSGSYALAPVSGMIDALNRDYAAMVPMIFGDAPRFTEIVESIRSIDAIVNR